SYRESQTAISGLGRRVGQLDAGQTENAEYQGTKPDQSPHPTATRLVLPSSSSKGSLHRRGFNKIILLGTSGKDPEIRQISEDRKFAKFSLATSYVFKDKEGNLLEKTDWHSISCFGRTAETAEKTVKKGYRVLVEGKLRYSEYTNKNGVDIQRTEIIADSIVSIKSPKQILLENSEGYRAEESSMREKDIDLLQDQEHRS
ncbi:hypothetical protein BB560_004675, partial [Smittium megazygosporum]